MIVGGKISEKYHSIILPGVGAFGSAMEKLNNSGFQNEILSFVERGGRLLGICVGMQVLFEESEEFGLFKGLGLLSGKVVKINQNVSGVSKKLKLPHIGWRKLTKNIPHPLNVSDDHDFYFVHSFKVECEKSNIVYSVDYGSNQIPAVVNYQNIYGFQFHPEKSRGHGLLLLKNVLS